MESNGKFQPNLQPAKDTIERKRIDHGKTRGKKKPAGMITGSVK